MSPSRARVLWIECDPLSGGSQSQVEFPLEAGPFFGGRAKPRIGDKISITVVAAGVRFRPKEMDCHHNDVWRLNLPTERQGLGGYAGKIICLERTSERGVFRAWLVPKNTSFARRLRSWTRRHGQLTYTRRSGGQKRYMGYF